MNRIPSFSRSVETAEDAEQPNNRKQKKKTSKSKEAVQTMNSLLSRRFVVLTRVAERIDRAFPEWLIHGFNKERGDYQPYDRDLPASLIRRPEGRNGYIDDPAITELGKQMSQKLGRSLMSTHMWPVEVIYVSPALRSIQTASMIIKGTGGPAAKLRVEPALCDYMGWYEKLPTFMSPDYLLDCGFPIDIDYKPMKTIDDMNDLIRQESLSMFYQRIAKAISKITKNPPHRCLFVLHAPCMDAAVKALKNSSGSKVNEDDFLHMGAYYPYSSTLTLALDDSAKWSYVYDPIPSISYKGISNHVNPRFIERTTVVRQQRSNNKKSTLSRD